MKTDRFVLMYVTARTEAFENADEENASSSRRGHVYLSHVQTTVVTFPRGKSEHLSVSGWTGKNAAKTIVLTTFWCAFGKT